MRIELKCRCGAQAVFEDERGAHIARANGSEYDDKGRTYLIEVRADEWQNRHQVCLEAGITEVPR